MGSMLHLKVRPPSGDGDTHFANMYAAYDAVSHAVSMSVCLSRVSCRVV